MDSTRQQLMKYEMMERDVQKRNKHAESCINSTIKNISLKITPHKHNNPIIYLEYHDVLHNVDLSEFWRFDYWKMIFYNILHVHHKYENLVLNDAHVNKLKTHIKSLILALTHTPYFNINKDL